MGNYLLRRQSVATRIGIVVGMSLLITTFAVSWCYSSHTMSIHLHIDGEVDELVADGISDLSRPLIAWSTAAMMASPRIRLSAKGQRAADALIVTTAATELIKQVAKLPRPESDDPRLVDLGLAPPSDGHGFPSGHASAAFAFATVMADADRENRWLWYGAASAVSWSRVEVHAHHTWDVVAGAALGNYIARRSLHSDNGLLGVVGLEPKRVKWGEATLTLGPGLVPGGVSFATLEF